MEGDGGKIAQIERLHAQYGGLLYDKCVRLLGNPTDAEEAVQETFLSAYRHWDSFTYGDSHLPWLYRIATNACFKIMRTQRRKGFQLLEDYAQMPASQSHPLSAMHARRILNRVVDELDERGNQILVAHWLDGMTQQEIADMLGISRRAVVKRLTALRKRIEQLETE